MKVLSQDRKKLFIIDSGYIGCAKVYGGSDDCSLVYKEYGYDEYYSLGTYDCEESAMAVLNELYAYKDYVMPSYDSLENGKRAAGLKQQKPETLEEISARHSGGLAKELRGRYDG